MLDQLSQRYGITPTEGLRRATTFDLYVMNASISYENYRQQIATTGRAPVPKLSQERMLDMIKAVRNVNKTGNR